jgi:hypothetical protein
MQMSGLELEMGVTRGTTDRLKLDSRMGMNLEM